MLYQYFRRRRETIKMLVPDHVKNTHNKIIVSGDKLKIFTRPYYEDKQEEEFSSTSVMLDSLVRDTPPGKVLKHVSVLSYEDFFLRGEQKTLNSYPVYMSEPLIRYKLKAHELIDIYYKEEDVIKAHFLYL